MTIFEIQQTKNEVDAIPPIIIIIMDELETSYSSY